MAPSIIGGRYSRYDWYTDFPIGKQSKAPEESSTNITLEFQLSASDVDEFKNDIKSNLNGTLPILISFGKRGFDVSVQKPGRGHATLNKKSTRVADFVSRRIRFEYIPTIRTATSATRVITQLVDRELSELEEIQEYQYALDKIEEIQRPVFENLATTIQKTVENFLPSVRSVRLEAKRDARQRALRREVEILVDDGHETKLERKGDGVQSLVALALMRHASEQAQAGSSTVIAIEVPESHLHPSAIHELRAVIEDLSQKNQIVLSSHSPLFVNMNKLSNTVIVKESRAKTATHVSEIRDALGVRFGDNLQNASIVLLVEGHDDMKAIAAIAARRSERISKAFDQGMLCIDYLGGASSLSQKASFYKSSACCIQCFIDDDLEGRKAVERAMKTKAINIREVNMCIVGHLEEGELEDIYDCDVYRQAFQEQLGVDPKEKLRGRSKNKWSSRTERRFREARKPWSDAIKAEVKSWLAGFAASKPDRIVKAELEAPLATFISSVEAKLSD